LTCADLFAGKPAPTGSPQVWREWVSCGSGFTREEAITGIPLPVTPRYKLPGHDLHFAV